MTTFNFDTGKDFLSKRTITECDTYFNAIMALTNKSGIEIVSYPVKHHLVPNNLGFIEKDNHGRYFTEIELERNADVYTNFDFRYTDVSLDFIVQGEFISLDNDYIILSMCSVYTPLKIRFTFDEKPRDIILTYKGLLLNPFLKESILEEKEITTSGIKYRDGCCFKC